MLRLRSMGRTGMPLGGTREEAELPDTAASPNAVRQQARTNHRGTEDTEKNSLRSLWSLWWNPLVTKFHFVTHLSPGAVLRLRSMGQADMSLRETWEEAELPDTAALPNAVWQRERMDAKCRASSQRESAGVLAGGLTWESEREPLRLRATLPHSRTGQYGGKRRPWKTKEHR